MSRTQLTVANWKLFGSQADLRAWLDACDDFRSQDGTVVLCPPYPYLFWGETLAQKGVELGAQDVSVFDDAGAHTGRVSASMLADLGVRWCLIGHSECRTEEGHDDDTIAKKAVALVRHGIRPILCVGETREERDAGRTIEVVTRQVAAVAEALDDVESLVVAYEPVWAIGAKAPATMAEVAPVVEAVRAMLPEATVLYGGSVTQTNAHDFLSDGLLDGTLVGSAARKGEQMNGIHAALLAGRRH